MYDIRPGEIDLPTFPLFALFAPALGMTAVIPQMDFTRPGTVDPRRILGPAAEYSATTMFGSPALLNRVGRYAEKHNDQADRHETGHLRRCAGPGVRAGAFLQTASR